MTRDRMRRMRFLTSLRAKAAWHRVPLEASVARDVRLGRRVKVRLAPHRSVRLCIAEKCQVADGVVLEFQGGSLVVGEGVDLREGTVLGIGGRVCFEGPNIVERQCRFHCDEAITVGAEAAMAEYVTVVDSSHRHGSGESWFVHHVVSAPVVIGPRAWIGAKATIARGTDIGAGAVVSANSLVVRDVPPGDLVSGVPAAPVGKGQTEGRPVNCERYRSVRGCIDSREPGPGVGRP